MLSRDPRGCENGFPVLQEIARSQQPRQPARHAACHARVGIVTLSSLYGDEHDESDYINRGRMTDQ